MTPLSSTTALTTDRLVLRPTSADDEAALAETFAHPDMGPWIWFIQATPPAQFARDWCERAAHAEDEYLFSILENGLYIGSINLHIKGTTAEVGYWLHPAHQGRGYIHESLERVIEFAFSDLKLGSLFATYAVSNAASARVLEKCGFTNAEGMIVKTVEGVDRPSVKVTLFKASSPE